MILGKDTLKGPQCWVCGVRFKNSTPPGPANREDHHIFPRNAGGTDGPEVSLCERHHATIHKVASRVHSSKKYDDVLVGETHIKKLLWLAHMIVKAESMFKDDPNKLLRNGVQLNQQETEMMKRLQSVHTDKSRSDIFVLGLKLLYHKTFSKNS